MLPNTEPENTLVITPTPRNRNGNLLLTRIMAILAILLIVTIVILGYLVAVEKDLNPMLWKTYLSPKEDWNEVFNEASENCGGKQNINQDEVSYSNLSKIEKQIRTKMEYESNLSSLKTASRAVYDKNGCWVVLVWVVDSLGRGMAGYANSSGELITYYVKYPEDLETIKLD